MSWMDIDDGILDHPKFIRAVARGGGDTVFLWLGLRSYVAKQLTDGLIPADMIDEVRGPKGARRGSALAVLKEVGLVDDAPDGAIQLHDYLQWSKSKAQVLALRERNRQRQAESRARHAVTDTVTNEDVTPSVTLPSPHLTTPHRSNPGEGAQARPRPQRSRRAPESWQPKPEHVSLGMQLGVVSDVFTGEVAKFRDHEFDTARSDWDAAFRNWLRRSLTLRRETISARQQPQNYVPSEQVPYHRILR